MSNVGNLAERVTEKCVLWLDANNSKRLRFKQTASSAGAASARRVVLLKQHLHVRVLARVSHQHNSHNRSVHNHKVACPQKMEIGAVSQSPSRCRARIDAAGLLPARMTALSALLHVFTRTKPGSNSAYSSLARRAALPACCGATCCCNCSNTACSVNARATPPVWVHRSCPCCLL